MMKKIISLLLVFTLLICALPTFALASEDALAVILCGSDYQNNCYSPSYNRYLYDNVALDSQPRTISFSSLLSSVSDAGIVPDATLFVGDYTDHFQSDLDGAYCAGDGIRKMESMLNSTFGADYTDTHTTIFTQGNHDYSGAYGLSGSGLQPYDEDSSYLVYVINESQFPYDQSSTSFASTVSATAQRVSADLDELVRAGEMRPVLIACHVPLHYSARSSGTDNTYAQLLFDVINDAAKILNVFFLYGHNHSGNPNYAPGSGNNDGRYEDAWGGAVNYVARGELLDVNCSGHGSKVGANHQKLNFTYLNAGYIGYSNSSANSTLTLTVLSVYENRLTISRYDANGEYTQAESLGQTNPNSPGDGKITTYPISVSLRENSPYEITAAASNTLYGQVSYDGISATAFPNVNYTVSGWSLSPEDAATVTQVDNAFYFTQLSADCTFTVIFTEETCASEKFTDIDTTRWYHDGVDFSISHALFNGTSSTQFSPDLTMTRAMLATVLYRLDNSPAILASNIYSDVEKDQWYSKAITWASVTGIANGVGDGKFDPHGNVTREQMAAFLYRYAAYCKLTTPEKADLSAYADDARISSYARSAMQWAVGAGIINGVCDQTLAPQDGASRAQVATILMRFCLYIDT